MTTHFCSLLLCAALSTAACDPQAPTEDEPVAAATEALLVGNGLSLNGTQIGPAGNGPAITGFALNASSADTSLTGTTINLLASQGGAVIPVSNVTLDGTQFRGVREGVAISGLDFKYARMPGRLSDGRKITVRVQSIQRAAAPNDDVYQYELQYWITGTSTAWTNLCPSGELAVPAAGKWDGKATHIDSPGDITFSCASGAIAKCIMLGYKPWLSYTENIGGPTQTFSLKHHHQACTRALRADYCGDGHSQTINGVLVDIYDYFNISAPVFTYGWEWESAWTTEGARFLYSPMGRPSVLNPDYNHPETIPRFDMRDYVINNCKTKWEGVLWPQDPATSTDTALKVHEDTFQYGYWWATDSWAPMEKRVLLRLIH